MMNTTAIIIGILGVSFVVYLIIILRYAKQKKKKETDKSE